MSRTAPLPFLARVPIVHHRDTTDPHRSQPFLTVLEITVWNDEVR
jgi:hypothetical protein